MKRIYSYLVALFALAAMPLGAFAQGWPANYGGVMLQGFYWNSFSDTQWSNLTSQADMLSKYFNLIWVPQSGYCNTTSNNMGYYPIYWFNQKSAFGTEAELRTMIKTFKDKGTGIIADVVINHKNGATKWCDLANETVTGQNTGKTYSVSWDHTNYTQICKDDEGNTNKSSEAYGKIKGAGDTGLGDGGCRDLDHTNATTQANIKTYEDYLLNELGYTGFRYDFVKGYDPKYIKLYNESSKPTYSVAEYWQGSVTDTKSGDHPFGGVKDWVEATGYTSAAFDFPMKYFIESAFANSNWSSLVNYTSKTLAGVNPQYAVTFIDNHDTSDPHENPDQLRANIAAANAYLLAMPGTPCIFLKHWLSYKTIIKKCILARKLAGITNTSSVTTSSAVTNGYVLGVKGSNGSVLLLLGTPTYDTTGYQLVCEGDNFKYYVSDGLDISGITSIKDETTHTIPSFCKVNSGETCAFFEQPTSSAWSGTIYCWAWDSKGNYTGGTWPGVACTKVGTTDDGKTVWKWTWSGKYTGSSVSAPTGIIFTNKTAGSSQTNDMSFKNGNYYGVDVVYGNVIDNAAAGIRSIKASTVSSDPSWYTLSGVRLSKEPMQSGVYIHEGKKVVK